MRQDELLIDAFGRVHELVGRITSGLPLDRLTFRPDAEANTIAWLVWHLSRVEDDHVAGAAGLEQVWTAEGWASRFGLPFDTRATGYGQSPSEVAQVAAPAELLLGYHEAVHRLALRYLAGLDGGELDRIVDDSWDPPVSVGTRLVSVLGDALQHAGQAAYVRGLAERQLS